MSVTTNIKAEVTRAAINSVPSTTGVYLFTQKGRIMYVGKSINLKARLLSHLENAKIDNKEAAIINNSDTIECIVTDSEFNALFLESKLIKTHKPRYNRRWIDDKNFLYIKVTVGDDYPKIFPVRKESEKKSKYFGPFSSTQNINEILHEIRRVFPFCVQKKITKRACFYSKIHLCNPCPSKIESLADGEEKKRLKRLYRQNIRNIVKVFEGQTDLVLKDLYKQVKQLTSEENYEEAIKIRNRIYKLERLIHQKLFGPDTMPNFNRSAQSLNSLLELLSPYFSELKALHRIECYDVSNFAGKEATASMVVFTDGLIDKGQYRKFKIKGELLRSDFEMMQEVFQRRFRNIWEKPNLVIVDGGKPQVRIVMQTMQQLGEAIPIVGIAKNPDRFVIGKNELQTLKPMVQNPGYQLIQAMRDESHRFAKKYHTELRRRRLLQ